MLQASLLLCVHASFHRSFLQLTAVQRSQAIDILAANLRYICSSAQQLLSEDDTPCAEALKRHKNGLKMIVYLLHIISMQAHKDSEDAKGAENAAAKPAKATGQLMQQLFGSSTARALNRVVKSACYMLPLLLTCLGMPPLLQ